MADEDAGGVFITTRELYELFVQMNHTLTEIRTDFAAVKALLEDTRADQSEVRNRLVDVERWQQRLPAMLFTAVASAIASVTSIVLGFARMAGKS